jgi:hypothetical protein
MQAFECPGIQISSLFCSAIYCQVTVRRAGIPQLWRPICIRLVEAGRPECSLDSPERPCTKTKTIMRRRAK